MDYGRWHKNVLFLRKEPKDFYVCAGVKIRELAGERRGVVEPASAYDRTHDPALLSSQIIRQRHRKQD